jgi:hypothetical protein
MRLLPAVGSEVVSVAVPERSSVAAPSSVEPPGDVSENVTVPVGVPAPDDNVAGSVTYCPATDGLGKEVSVVCEAVSAGLRPALQPRPAPARPPAARHAPAGQHAKTRRQEGKSAHLVLPPQRDRPGTPTACPESPGHHYGTANCTAHRYPPLFPGHVVSAARVTVDTQAATYAPRRRLARKIWDNPHLSRKLASNRACVKGYGHFVMVDLANSGTILRLDASGT